MHESIPPEATAASDLRPIKPPPPPVARGEQGNPEDGNPTGRLPDGRPLWRADLERQGGLDTDKALHTLRLADRMVTINVAYHDQALVDKAVEALGQADQLTAEGLSEPWRQLPLHQDPDIGLAHFCDAPEGEQPTLFAKVSRSPTSAADTQAMLQVIDEMPGLSEAERFDMRQETLVRAGWRHELELAPEVRHIIESEAAQAIVQAYGAAGVSYVAPLAVAENPAIGHQAIVYPWQTGYPAAELNSDQLTPEAERLRTASANPYELPSRAALELSELFEAHGICPSDMDVDNFMVEERADGPYLHLCDTEFFYRTRPPE
jgi:hypothetical protein